MKARISIALVALFAFTLAGCPAPPAVSVAKTVDQKAYAVYGTFVIVEKQAAQLVSNPAIPPKVVVAVSAAHAKAKPVMDKLLDATMEYSKIAAQFDKGGTGNDKLQIAADNLNQWIIEGTPLVNDLVTAVKGATQ